MSNYSKQEINSFTTTNNKLTIYTEHLGNAQNPAILLISGAMASARFWFDKFCKNLSDASYFVIRYDHRDTGLSSAINYSKNPYTLNDLANDAIAILDAYQIQKAHIIGHSMGGSIAQLLTLDYPTRISSITAISSSVLAPAALNEQEKKMLEKTWQQMMKNKPTKNYDESVEGFLESFRYLHGDIPIEETIAKNYIKDMYKRTLPEHLEWFEKFSTGIEPLHNHVKAQQNISDRTKDLKHIKTPLFIIHGEKDYLAFPRIVREYYANLIDTYKMHIITDMGHMILNRDLFTQIECNIIKNLETIK